MMEATRMVLLAAACLYCTGLYLVLSRRHAIAVLAGVELMLNAANLNLIGMSSQYDGAQGHAFGLFAMVLGVAEVAVALALVLLLWRQRGTVQIDEV